MNTLTNEQKYVVDCLLKGHNVALMGSAGCGKSYLISTIYEEFPALKKLYTEEVLNGSMLKLPRIQLTALTGCASLLLGHRAKTLHSWSGIGLGKGTVQELFTKIRRNAKAMKNWLCTDLLIIDEISMMTAELLDKLNQLGKKIRPLKNKPFGGMQVMLVGDFCQLPPVNKNKDEPIGFAFESEAWRELFSSDNGKCIELTVIQRQKDETFQRVLKEARRGELSKESCALLRSNEGRDWKNNLIRPTLLFPRRAEVDMINDANLRALEGRRYTYDVKLVYDGKVPIGFDVQDEGFKKALELYDSEAGYARHLELALDTQVMLVANIAPDEGLMNGSRGVVVGFCPSTDLPIVQFVNGVKKTIGTHCWPIDEYEFVSRAQIPLRLAYSITIHRCQGATLDSALVDIGSGIFEFGQAYVALSRVRSLDALYIYDFDPTAFRTHPKVKQFYSSLQSESSSQEGYMVDELIQIMADKLANNSDLKSIDNLTSDVIRGVHVNKLE